MENREVGFVVNDEYKAWIEDIKKRIKQSQIKAAVKVNYELLELYWGIGRDIVAKQKHAKWGDAFLATMSKDLQKSFPDMSGFSVQNLKSIRYWYKFYNSEENGLQPVSQFTQIIHIQFLPLSADCFLILHEAPLSIRMLQSQLAVKCHPVHIPQQHYPYLYK